MLEFIKSWRAVKDTAKDTAKDAYIAGAKTYGLSFGDRVIVTYSVPSYLAGWDNAWASHMDMYVGKTGVVVQCPPSKDTYDPTGIGVCFDSDVRGSTPLYRFPWFVLRKLEDRQVSCDLRVFQHVLVRQSDSSVWAPQIFWRFDADCDFPFLCLGRSRYRYCIPYNGNEHLMGTS